MKRRRVGSRLCSKRGELFEVRRLRVCGLISFALTIKLEEITEGGSGNMEKQRIDEVDAMNQQKLFFQAGKTL